MRAGLSQLLDRGQIKFGLLRTDRQSEVNRFAANGAQIKFVDVLKIHEEVVRSRWEVEVICLHGVILNQGAVAVSYKLSGRFPSDGICATLAHRLGGAMHKNIKKHPPTITGPAEPSATRGNQLANTSLHTGCQRRRRSCSSEQRAACPAEQ